MAGAGLTLAPLDPAARRVLEGYLAEPLDVPRFLEAVEGLLVVARR